MTPNQTITTIVCDTCPRYLVSDGIDTLTCECGQSHTFGRFGHAQAKITLFPSSPVVDYTLTMQKEYLNYEIAQRRLANNAKLLFQQITPAEHNDTDIQINEMVTHYWDDLAAIKRPTPWWAFWRHQGLDTRGPG